MSTFNKNLRLLKVNKEIKGTVWAKTCFKQYFLLTLTVKVTHYSPPPGVPKLSLNRFGVKLLNPCESE